MNDGQAITIERIEEQLRRLPEETLESVFDYVSFLIDRQSHAEDDDLLLASEEVLARDWLRPEEDAAWAHL